MTFIIFPVLVLIMVILVVIAYNRLHTLKKKLDETRKSIQRLQKKELQLMKDANGQLMEKYPEKEGLFEGVNFALAQAEANNGKNLSESIAYHRSMRPALEELLLNAENFPGWVNHADFKEYQGQQKELAAALKNLMEHYHSDAARFNKALTQFPNNLLAGMAGLMPYEYYEL